MIIDMIRGLAEYERSIDEVQVDRASLAGALFCPSPKAFAHVGEHDGIVEAMAIWFVTYSTWTGKHGIHVEDLYVRPEARGLGLGRALMAGLARTAVAAGYARLEWSVLDWNGPAIGFYRHLGAAPMEEWRVYRLAGPSLSDLAAGS